jgi:hypothetical protein
MRASGAAVRGDFGVAIAAAAILAVGLALRVAGARGDLWLDEIWTINLLAERAATPLDVFWRVQHDNNHHLYSLYAWFLPVWPPSLVLRLPAVLAGAATVAVAGLIGARRGRAEALIAMLLVALSYPLVHYGSEARGYGPMLLWALAAFHLVDADMAEGVARRRGRVALVLGAGFLFHLSMALVAGALGLWVLHAGWRETGSFAAARRRARAYFLPSLALFLALVVLLGAALAVNGYEIGGREPAAGFAARFVDNVGGTVGLVLGLPLALPHAASLAIAALAAAAAIVLLARRGDARAPFYAIVVFLFPGLLFVAGAPSSAFGRYYLFGLVFLLPLAAQVLALGWRRGGAARLAAAAALAFFLVGSIQAHALFLTYGRGDYRAALRFIAANTPGEVIEIGSDHPFRQPTVLDYYLPQVAPEKRIDHVPADALEARRPVWLLVHRGPAFPPAPPPPGAETLEVGGAVYPLAAVFRHWGLSGFDWLVYRRDGPA